MTLSVDFWPRLFSGERPPITPRPPMLASSQCGRPVPTARRTTAQPEPEPARPGPPAPSEPARGIRRLWQGGQPAILWRHLLQGIVLMAMTALAFVTTVSLARWPEPMKHASLTLALVTVLMALFGAWSLARVLYQLGLQRLLVILVICYLLLISVKMLTWESGLALPQEAMAAHKILVWQGQTTLARFVRSLAAGVSELVYAYTGRWPSINLPDVPDSGPILTAVVAETLTTPLPPRGTLTPGASRLLVAETPGAPTEPEIRAGGYVKVVNTRGQHLRARAGPGLDYQVQARFEEGARLLVLDGPREADGYTWWKVQDDGQEGWCAADWLQPAEGP